MAGRTLEQVNTTLDKFIEDFQEHVKESDRRQDNQEQLTMTLVSEIKGMRDDLKEYVVKQDEKMKPVIDVFRGSNFMGRFALKSLAALGGLLGVLWMGTQIVNAWFPHK